MSSSVIVPDSTIKPVLDFLISDVTDYRDLGHLSAAFNNAVDGLRTSSFTGSSYQEYLNAVHQKFQDLGEEYYALKMIKEKDNG